MNNSKQAFKSNLFEEDKTNDITNKRLINDYIKISYFKKNDDLSHVGKDLLANIKSDNYIINTSHNQSNNSSNKTRITGEKVTSIDLEDNYYYFSEKHSNNIITNSRIPVKPPLLIKYSKYIGIKSKIGKFYL